MSSNQSAIINSVIFDHLILYMQCFLFTLKEALFKRKMSASALTLPIISNYKDCLEKSLKEAHKWNVQIPDHRLTSFNKELLNDKTLKPIKEDKDLLNHATLIFDSIQKRNCTLSSCRIMQFLKSYQFPSSENK